ncbi:DnaB-like helicase C-terminal domain-containing protein [Egicoccus sp. AB-alg6-2]|uniref:DnaB-like helicase C-terminal domain-containing protein n=1 Tax=Egicoccus sp. AB-alg6-2 TaxID=3242692 RepID=UPI00359E38D2
MTYQDELRLRPLTSSSSAKTLKEAAFDAYAAAAASVGRPRATPLRTGFDVLDQALGGGFRPGDLVVFGGAPGVGKTIAALQVARRAAVDGRSSVYVSYEHDHATMLGRLLALELAELPEPGPLGELDRLARVAVEAAAGFRSLQDVLDAEPLLGRAYGRLDSYAERLVLVQASGTETDLVELQRLAGQHLDPGGLLVVDYLQRVPSMYEDANDHVTAITQQLKDLAAHHQVVVLALVAADWDGLRTGRLRMHHLRGSTALAYECDVAILLNDKHQAVAKAHLAYDTANAERFRQAVVFSVEKNRGGPAMVDVEFRKDFVHYRFDPRGAYLRERLVDDRLAGE